MTFAFCRPTLTKDGLHVHRSANLLGSLFPMDDEAAYADHGDERRVIQMVKMKGPAPREHRRRAANGDLLGFAPASPADQAALNLANDLFYQSFLSHRAAMDEEP